MKLQWLDRTLMVASHHYTLCTTEKLYKKALKHLNIPKGARPAFMLNEHSSATTHFFAHPDGQQHTSVICIKDTEGRTRHQINALLVHEAVHVWQATKDDYGEKNPSHEFEAYAIQNISQALME